MGKLETIMSAANLVSTISPTFVDGFFQEAEIDAVVML